MAAWVWPPILISSLAAMIVLSRAGSTIFWRAKGQNSEQHQAQFSQLLSISLLGIALVSLVIFGGPLSEISSQAADDIFNLGHDLKLAEKVDA